MWVPADIENAVRIYPDKAALALSAMQLGDAEPPLNAAALNGLAAFYDGNVGEAWRTVLESTGRLDIFARALAVQGVPIDFSPPPPLPPGRDLKDFQDFCRRLSGFHCRIERGTQPVGSGVLIGPTSVLTSWHVITSVAPNAADPVPPPKIKVRLSDGQVMSAVFPPLSFSKCSLNEYAYKLPVDEAELAGFSDFAVLQLERAVGPAFGMARLAKAPQAYANGAAIVVVHYPLGVGPEISLGSIGRLRGLKSRWSHSVGTDRGSSGGGCFDSAYAIMGIHQGRGETNRGRLVPASCFHADVARIVANDIAPPRVWSLDGSPDGEFILGRSSFFDGFAAASRDGPIRGIRVKRADPTADTSGLAFSYRILDRLVARDPSARLCRLSFETLVEDLVSYIASRVTACGLSVDVPAAVEGVAKGQTQPEAIGADRGRRLALAINSALEPIDQRLWLYFDHPALAFGDEIRSTLEAFVDQLILLPRVRIVIAGFEAVPLPGAEYANAAQARAESRPGLVTDYISGFAPSDITAFLSDASLAAGKTLSMERIAELTQLALADLPHSNGILAPWLAEQAAERLRPAIRALFAETAPVQVGEL